MNIFLAVQSADDPIRDEEMASWNRAADEYLPFDREGEHLWRSASRRTAVLTFWNLLAENGLGSYHAVQGPELLALDGYFHPRSGDVDGSYATWALDRVAAGRTPLDIRATVRGEYHLTFVDRDETIWSFGAEAGSLPFYYGSNGRLRVVSNRAGLVAYALRGTHEMQIDELAIVTACVEQLVCGNRTYHADVQQARFGEWIRISPERGLEVVRAPDILVDEELMCRYRRGDRRVWDEAVEVVREIASCAMSVPVQAPIKLELSGGKDSRFVLAMLMNAGKVDRLTSLVTSGYAYNADRVVGRQIGEHYGFRQELRTPTPSVDRVERVLGMHLFQSEGLLPSYNYRYKPKKTGIATLAGHHGTLLRQRWGNRHALTFDACKAYFQSRREGNLYRIFTEEARRTIRDYVGDWFDARRDRDLDPRDLANLWPADHWYNKWTTYSIHGQSTGGLLMSLMCDADLFRHAFAMGYYDRTAMRLFYEVMRRADPWLADFPFADVPWPRELESRLGIRAAPAVKSYSSPLAPKNFKVLVFNAENRSIFRRVVLDTDDDRLWRILDRKALVELLERSSDITGAQMQILWNVLGPALVLRTGSLAKSSMAKVRDQVFGSAEVSASVAPRSEPAPVAEMYDEAISSLLLPATEAPTRAPWRARVERLSEKVRTSSLFNRRLWAARLTHKVMTPLERMTRARLKARS